ncbi:Protein fem-1-like B, partial [Durusdinium trenchii]
QEEELFFSKLLPHRFDNLPDNSKIPVEIWRSLLPGLHCEPEVLWVLASGLNERVFDEKGARAIIELAWEEASVAHLITFLLDLIAALLFWGLAFLLNDPRLQEPLYDPQWLRTVVLLILILIWSRNVLIEVMQCVGFHAYGKLCQYFRSVENLGDALRIVMTGFSQIALATNWDKVQENQVLRIIFALTGFVRWLR